MRCVCSGFSFIRNLTKMLKSKKCNQLQDSKIKERTNKLLNKKLFIYKYLWLKILKKKILF